MSKNRYPIIAKEGWLLLFIVILLGLFLSHKFMPTYSIPVWIVVLILLYLFRDPYRNIPASPLAVVSPVEGKVESISTVKDHWIGREALRIRLRTGYGNTYALRSPMEGKVVRNWSSEPVTLGSNDKIHCHAIWTKSDENDDVLTAIYIGRVVSRFSCYAHPGERIGQGQRCGYFFLGGVVEVYLPVSTRVKVSVGDKVLSGTSVLAQLIRGKDSTLSPKSAQARDIPQLT